MAVTAICQKCGRQLREVEFYKSRQGVLHKFCKKCLTMHIDNFDPETFLWILQDLDFPYIEVEWNITRDKIYNEKGPDGMTGMSVFGKYISKMKLKQNKTYGWADSEKLNEENQIRLQNMAAQKEKFHEEMKMKMEAGEISEAEYKTLTTVDDQYKDAIENPKVASPVTIIQNPDGFYDESNFLPADALIDPAQDLTDDDKKMLAMKWGRFYKPQEWLELERMYTEMMNSFDIQDADTTNTLILLCKTNLKMNQAIDMGDLDGFQKLSKVSESLRKSAKFTAAQNKEQKNEFVDSVGELVSMCEREGFIPRFATDIPQDKVDLTLKDMNDYLHKLVTQDLGFGQQIEDSLKKIQIQKELNAEAEKRTLAEEDEGVTELENQDYIDYYEDIEAQRQADRERSYDVDGVE